MAPTRIPGIEYAAAPRAAAKASALAWPPRLVVIHDTGNNTSSRFDEAAFAASRTDPSSSWTSAHAYVDPGGVLGSLPLSLQAWAAYSYANQHGIHIEMCRTAAGVPAATIANTTPVVRWLCQAAGIPMVKLSPADVAAGRSGVCGHRDITIGLGVGDHEDPGANFPWAGFMAQVTGGDDMTLSQEQDNRLKNIDRWLKGLSQLDDPIVLAEGPWKNKLGQALHALEADVAGLKTAVADLAAKAAPAPVELTDADRADIAARVAEKLGALVFKAQQ